MGAVPASVRVSRSAPIRRLLVVVNRRAGTIQRHPDLPDALQRELGQRGELVAPGNKEELQRVVDRARAQGVDTIAMCGGDGTNLTIATAIATTYRDRAWPRLMLLPGGTLNTVARNLGCTGQMTSLLKQALASDEPRVVRQPLLQVNDDTGFIFGSQMVARVLDVYYAQYGTLAGALALTTRIVGSAALGSPFSRELFSAETARVAVDEEEATSQQFTCLMASTIRSPAMGIRALPRAGEGGGFHLIGTRESPSRIFREAGRVFAGLPLKTMCMDAVGHAATITFNRACRYTVDGDMFSAKEITLRATAPVEILLPPAQ